MYWAKDSFKGDDKLWHFIGGLISPIIVFIFFGTMVFWTIIISLAFWVLWEVKDGYVLVWKVKRWVKKKELSFWLGDLCIWLSGDGFSWKDAVMSWAGVLLGWLIVEAMAWSGLSLT